MAICPNPTFDCLIDRTLDNLNNYSGQFEITNLINSLLSLLVFPTQAYFPENANLKYKNLIETLLREHNISLENMPQSISDISLYSYIRKLRNGLAHAHILPISSNDEEIDKLKIWNINENEKENNIKDFEVEFSFHSVEGMKNFLKNFCAFLKNINTYEILELECQCIDFKFSNNTRVIAIYRNWQECCIFKFCDNTLICLTKCKTLHDEKCSYPLNESILQKITEILESNFYSTNDYSTCKMNSYGHNKYFWEILKENGLAIYENGIYKTTLYCS